SLQLKRLIGRSADRRGWPSRRGVTRGHRFLAAGRQVGLRWDAIERGNVSRSWPPTINKNCSPPMITEDCSPRRSPAGNNTRNCIYNPSCIALSLHRSAPRSCSDVAVFVTCSMLDVADIVIAIDIASPYLVAGPPLPPARHCRLAVPGPVLPDRRQWSAPRPSLRRRFQCLTIVAAVRRSALSAVSGTRRSDPLQHNGGRALRHGSI
ncbi:unnamed protein product, partial [Urochloa humidicola]